MNYLSVENLSLNYGEKILFENLSLFINKSDKIALVAKNGTGKSTMLKILAGLEVPSAATKLVIHKDIKTSFLHQDPQLDWNQTIEDLIFDSGNPKLKAVKLYEQCLNEGIVDERLTHSIEELERLNAWDIESSVKTILSKLNLHDLKKIGNTLSGGQKKRVALAKILIDEPDFLIFDEPTNHLDPEMIEWLEEYLKSDKLTLLMVTHDRYFLDRVCNQILELEDGVLYKYKGNYSYYLEKKQERIDIKNANIDKAQNLYRKELDWMRRMPQARSTKAKSRIDAFYDTEKVAKQKIVNEQVQLEIVTQRMGNKILEFRNVQKKFGDLSIVKKFDYKFKRQEKVGIVGKNGVGKSTFLNMIMGRELPDVGEIVVGDTIKIGYYTQDGIQLNEDKRVIEVVKEVANFIPLKGGREVSASQMLERFLFSPKDQYTFVSKLSGGEKRRLTLLMVLMENPNFLILDEPTNDLDILTLNVLEDFLEEFDGCLIVVTHDRYFMDKLVDHLFVFEGEGIIKDFNGTYREYLAENMLSSKISLVAPPEKVPDGAKKISYQEQKELRNLETEIARLEKEKSDLAEKLYILTDYTEIEKISTKIGKLGEQIDQKTERWLELSA
jgi:ATP-binding cassette subfamily F protein uup